MVPYPQTAQRMVISSPAGADFFDKSRRDFLSRCFFRNVLILHCRLRSTGTAVRKRRATLLFLFQRAPGNFQEARFSFQTSGISETQSQFPGTVHYTVIYFYHFQMPLAQFFHTNSIFIVLKCHKTLVFANGGC